jgi:glycerophosphoryl diester phosphodiesterase
MKRQETRLMKIFAHRGCSGHYPENTLAAFEAALTSGCDGIELDVFALQGELVVIHDRQLSRTTNGSGNLEDYTLAQLQQLDAGQGQSVPTLWQVLALVQNRCTLNIELKGHDTVAPLLQLLSKAQTELGTELSTLLISSFHHPLLRQLKQQCPTLAIGALTASIPLHYAAFATELAAVSVHCDRGFVDANLVQDAHQRGLACYVYTVNDAREALRLQQLGVDGIFSNYPAEARQWLKDQS